MGRTDIKKRKRSEEHGGGAVNRPAQKRKQHLYLLLDDWERGYSVRKLDVNAFDSAADTNLPPKGFTDQPLARIEAPHVRSWNFVSHDSKIFAMKAKEASPAIPAFDTNTLSLTICPWPSCHADYVIPLFASISDKLFLFLEDRTEYLGNPPPHDSNAPWSWTTINSPLPFYNMQIVCYALHPDGRTFFGDQYLFHDPMFDKESELHRGAKLIYMGDSKFCLVQSLFHKGDQYLFRDPTMVDLDNHCPPPRRRVLHMTTFGLKYNKAGNLQVMLRQAHAHMMFKRPHDLTEPSLEPLAFWI
nr:unnamed protein product [Digitaria exilis]